LSSFFTKFKIPSIQTKSMVNTINRSIFLTFLDFKILNKIVSSNFVSIIQIKNSLNSIISTYSNGRCNCFEKMDWTNK